MPNLKKGSECCGCTACEAVCGKRAIKMVPDALGFLYPEVDVTKCVECGMCEKVCSFSDDYKTPANFTEPVPYGIRLKDTEEMMKSRSGGAFVAFTNWVLEKGGAIYGAAFDDEFNVAHKRAVTTEGRDEFRGSKYVQSELKDTFRKVRSDLAEGRWVLFSGTGCQVAGLQSFIPDKLKTRLVTVDIVCHGVPSPNVWKDYKYYITAKYKGTITGVDFRNKRLYGWRDHKETLRLHLPQTNKEETVTNDLFTYLFYQHVMLRPSCGECHFCNTRRPADLTLADFWGWEKTDPTFNADNKGASLVLVNTPKGKMIMDEVKDSFQIIRPELKDCMQAHLSHPTTLNPLSENFRNDYLEHGFFYIAHKYGNISMQYKIKNLMSRVHRKLNTIKKNVLK